METRHAWYSKQQADLNGTLTYRLWESKKLVVCTELTTDKKYNAAWDDVEYLGEIICENPLASTKKDLSTSRYVREDMPIPFG